MTIYEFIEKNSEFGKELFSSKEIMLALKKMNEEERLQFIKEWDEKRKPKKVDKKEEIAYNNQTNGGDSEAKSVPSKRKRKTASESAQD